ncbi:hypothetical protein BJ508DRAFT_308815 [Ascobolus immersus RN42]|uniref:Uncharacterized protein n=1 Tax=Ascobolus immersus RN42 TaxID=1160509 RepID=A0A3N4I2L6_ASCIM|nr:hypothetical protein BJ508DRAFT_308815 [Ascobolus immersus RN42]
MSRLFELQKYGLNEQTFRGRTEAARDIVDSLEEVSVPTVFDSFTSMLRFLQKYVFITDELAEALTIAEEVVVGKFPGFPSLYHMDAMDLICSLASTPSSDFTSSSPSSFSSHGNDSQNPSPSSYRDEGKGERENESDEKEAKKDDEEGAEKGDDKNDEEGAEKGDDKNDEKSHKENDKSVDDDDENDKDKNKSRKKNEIQLSKVYFIDNPVIPMLPQETTFTQLTNVGEELIHTFYHGSNRTSALKSFERKGVKAEAGRGFYCNTSAIYLTTCIGYAIWYAARSTIADQINIMVSNGELPRLLERPLRAARLRDRIPSSLNAFPAVVLESTWSREDWWKDGSGKKWALKEAENEAKFILMNMDKNIKPPVTPPGATHPDFDIILGRTQGDSMKRTDMTAEHRSLIHEDPAFAAGCTDEGKLAFNSRITKVWAFNCPLEDRRKYKEDQKAVY